MRLKDGGNFRKMADARDDEGKPAPPSALTYWPRVRPGMIQLPRLDPTEQRVRAMFDSCVGKSAIAGVGGAGLGMAFGLFFASMDAGMTPGMDQTKMGTKELLLDTWSRMYVPPFGGLRVCCLLGVHVAYLDPGD